jgi:formamidopyrimidine-DNA glycosylase
MPELPDITVYVERLDHLLSGEVLRSVRLETPFVLRTVEPPLEAVEGRTVVGVTRLGKRVVLALESSLYLVMHLMVAGRLRWRTAGAKSARAKVLVAFDFDVGSLLFTEAGARRRASLHVMQGDAALATLDRGGLEVLQASPDAFREAMQRENHTLKRALTDPRILSGIGNAYSDEILHAARLSPFRQTRAMSDEELDHLLAVTRQVLTQWTERLREEVGEGFPDKVTAFRPGMAVHGRYRQPCPVCGAPVQRIVYASNESNYCAGCQTAGRVLADRALSRLLKANWPRRLEDLER